MNQTRHIQGFSLVQFMLGTAALAIAIPVGLGLGGVFGQPFGQQTELSGGSTDGLSGGLADTPQTPPPSQTADAAQTLNQSAIEFVSLSGRNYADNPLLERFMRKYHPGLTDQEIDSLTATVPPGGSQDIIVILPEVEHKQADSRMY